MKPAIKYPKGCHSGEGRNPGGYWMPDQVRHDGVGVHGCRIYKDRITGLWFAAVPSALAAAPDIPQKQGTLPPGTDANATAMTDIHDIKPALAWGPDLQWLYWALAVLAVVVLAALAWRFWQKRKRPAVPETPAPPIPADTEAYGLLDALAADGDLNPRQFNFRLSAILRRYMERLYEIPAAEMTTEELLPVVDRLPLQADLAQPLKDFCRYADPVKFAGRPADQNRMAGDLAFARDFVRRTTPQAEPDADIQTDDPQSGPGEDLDRGQLPLHSATHKRIND